MLFYLLQDSPEITPEEAKEIDNNQSLVAHQGRKPNLELQQKGESIKLTSWANELFDEMLGVAKMLNGVHSETCYVTALESQRELLLFPDKTPSAKVLSDIMNRDGSYYQFAKRKSEEHRDYFLARELDPDVKKEMELMALESLKQQAQLEADDRLVYFPTLHRLQES